MVCEGPLPWRTGGGAARALDSSRAKERRSGGSSGSRVVRSGFRRGKEGVFFSHAYTIAHDRRHCVLERMRGKNVALAMRLGLGAGRGRQTLLQSALGSGRDTYDVRSGLYRGSSSSQFDHFLGADASTRPIIKQARLERRKTLNAAPSPAFVVLRLKSWGRRPKSKRLVYRANRKNPEVNRDPLLPAKGGCVVTRLPLRSVSDALTSIALRPSSCFGSFGLDKLTPNQEGGERREAEKEVKDTRRLRGRKAPSIVGRWETLKAVV